MHYGNSVLEQESRAFIQRVWPTIGSFTNVAWAGYQADGITPVQTPPAPNDFWLLEGDQCLVFFLGGIPNINGKVTGFSNVPTNPAANSTDRTKLYDFDPGRLTLANANSPFPSFTDGFGKKPYVYFSSGRRPDGYNTAIPANALFNVSPYIQTAAVPAVPPNPGSPAKFWNSSTFQIISAGNDGNFGPGGIVWPSPSVSGGAMDDYSNFHDRKLGNP